MGTPVVFCITWGYFGSLAFTQVEMRKLSKETNFFRLCHQNHCSGLKLKHELQDVEVSQLLSTFWIGLLFGVSNPYFMVKCQNHY
jgi:hypothetical protein